ncbi:copper chaperone PCu(A)C [Massilia norwichensis]|uniref:Copper chaperone PCu(A)C n=1 Tax=Massilia norwichensis TaxID=1442366 RepID=A0ABT2A7A0_9BURK|nr:copper chaperone PCu(A)C [Massilia norwichensis]MCS0590023.1 copper chaperone PCu(A)C [Massilia norwichensis]
MKRLLALALAGILSVPALAQVGSNVTVSAPWIRATVPQAKVAGAFMQLKSARPARLVEVKSPVAGRVELHQMAMEGQTMRMRAVEAIDLPAGQTVNLASGGYHVMLFDLKQQLKEGEQVPLTLVVQDAAGKRENIALSVPVKALTYTAPAAH